jgi:hypothetical protein
VAPKTDAIAQLQEYAALTLAEATQLVDAVIAAAQDEAIAQIADDALVPASVADARVVRVARICTHLGRMLSPTEIEVILRVPRATSQSIIRRLRALYRSEVNGWIEQLVISQAEAPIDVSNEDTGERWEITFNDATAVGYAAEILRREGMTRDITINSQQQTLTVPKVMRDRQGNNRSSLDVLGIAPP